MKKIPFVVLTLLFAGACVPDAQQAQQQIRDMGYRYSTDGLIRAMEEGNKRVFLRFLIADTQEQIIQEVLFLLAGCEDRPYERADECLQHIRTFVSYDIDLHRRDSRGDTMVWYAAKAANVVNIEYLLRDGVSVGSQSVIDRIIAMEQTDFNQVRRERRKTLIPKLKTRWSLSTAREAQNQKIKSKTKDSFFQSNSQ